MQHLLQSLSAKVDFVSRRLLCLFLKTVKHHDCVGCGDEVRHPYRRYGISYPEFMNIRRDHWYRTAQRESEANLLVSSAKGLADLPLDCRRLLSDKGKCLRVKRDRLHR